MRKFPIGTFVKCVIYNPNCDKGIKVGSRGIVIESRSDDWLFIQWYNKSGGLVKANYLSNGSGFGWFMEDRFLEITDPFPVKTYKLSPKIIATIRGEKYDPIIAKIRMMNDRWINRNNPPRRPWSISNAL